MVGELEISLHEVEDFVHTRVWKFIVATLMEKVGAKEDELHTLDPVLEGTKMSRAQGAIVAYGEVIDLPAILNQMIEYESKEKKERGEG